MKMKTVFRVESLDAAAPRLFAWYCCAQAAVPVGTAASFPRRVQVPTSTNVEQPGGHAGCEYDVAAAAAQIPGAGATAAPAGDLA